jgi:3'-phosphoadenosine 5'-phosphosulfate sulfotransferase
MSSVSSLLVSTVASATAPQTAPANASAELAKYESQLSDWVHCASSKTSAGKAKIAEITDKIESIKAQVKLAEEAKPSPRNHQAEEVAAKVPQRQLRLDQLGTWLDVRA